MDFDHRRLSRLRGPGEASDRRRHSHSRGSCRASTPWREQADRWMTWLRRCDLSVAYKLVSNAAQQVAREEPVGGAFVVIDARSEPRGPTMTAHGPIRTFVAVDWRQWMLLVPNSRDSVRPCSRFGALDDNDECTSCRPGRSLCAAGSLHRDRLLGSRSGRKRRLGGSGWGSSARGIRAPLYRSATSR
jgi:hypothetical protein